MVLFLEVPREHVEDVTFALAVKALRFALGRTAERQQPVLRWFVESSKMPNRAKTWSWGSFEHDVDRGKVLRGMAEIAPRTIWLADDLSPSELVVTVGHELDHLVNGHGLLGTSYKDAEEERAERFGTMTAREFADRPAAVKSMSLPTPSLYAVSEDRLAGFEDLPDVSGGVDLGDELYPDRPLILDGWGHKMERIGRVTDVGLAEPERLFYMAQMDRSRRYRDTVDRLVQQGAMEPTALFPRRMKANSLPMAGVLLQPAAA